MADSAFRLTSPSFDDGQPIPARYTCEGEDVSPGLAWDGAPDGTAAFAIVVDDPDADGFVHWIAYNLTGSRSGALAEGASASPDGPPQGVNDFGRIGWSGPCPPPGRPHRYRFRLTALSAPADLAGAVDAAALEAAVRGLVLGTASLEGTYRRDA